MSQQIVSGGAGVFPTQHNTSIGPGWVNDNATHVDTLHAVKKVKKNVNLANHCIFCLRRISANPETITLANISNYSANADELKEVPCAPPEYFPSAAPPLLFVLNKIWSRLQKGGYWDWNDNEENSEQRSTQFTGFPKICYFCGDKFGRICDLMFQLKEEINKLGVIIRESKKGGAYSWRAESFEQTLKDSDVDIKCISDTLECLGIPQERQSSTVPASLDSRTLGVTKETEIPSVITETLSREHAEKEETSASYFDFHDEGSEDDASNDPNYVKEEEDAFLDREGSDSATQDFDNDPLDGDSDSKPELDQSLTSASKLVERSTDLTLVSSRNQVKTPIRNDINSAKKATSTKDKFVCAINGCAETWDCLKEIKIHQPKHHSNTDQEMSGQQQQKPKNMCSICKKMFPKRHNLHRHMKSVHVNAKVPMVTCDLCKMHVPQKELYEHVHVHVGEEYLIRCPNPNPGQCSFVCCTLRGLQSHLRSRIACRTATPDVNDKYLKPRDAFICQVCGDDLGSLISVRSHLYEWHEKEGRKEFPCPIQECPQRFNFRQSVLLHIPLHASEVKSESQACDVCKENIKFEEMEEHLKDAHHLSQEKIIKCFQCPSLFSDRTNLVDHLYEHRHIALFCDICGDPDTTFYKLNDLRIHYFEVHKIGSKFLCEHCDREYFSARGLEEHLTKRHPAAAAPKKQKMSRKDPLPGCSADVFSDALIAEKKFKCNDCDAWYTSKQSLRRHKITVHQGKLFPCKFCNETFSSIAIKYSHEKKHRRGPVGPKNERFPCQVAGCEKEFSAKRNLKYHIAFAHGQNPNVCDQCGKAYACKSGLVHHIQAVHMGVRDHVCDVCGESFSSVTILNRHKLIHTGDRPFACQLCGQKFRHKGVLKKHVEAHERKGAEFKPNGPMKQLRKRVDLKSKTKK